MDLKYYFKNMFQYDLKAGFVTSIVALPLAIGFSVASGLDPYIGLCTAVVAGVLASLFGGSKYAITGPAGSLTVLILSTTAQFGLEGLFVAAFLAGLIQIFLGFFDLGRLIHYIPRPVVSGFTGGIGLLIIIGQIPSIFGLSLSARTHTEKFIEIVASVSQTNGAAILMTAVCLFVILFFPKFTAEKKYVSSVPATFIALILSVVIFYALGLEIPTVGEIYFKKPDFSFSNITPSLIFGVFPAAFSLALVGSISSLLCVVVCDSMTASKHNSKKELYAQGICNIVLPVFGFMPAAGGVARSIVNIREGARTRLAGIIHALFIFICLVFLGHVGAFLPKAAIAAILISVASKMIHISEIKMFFKISRHEAAIYMITMFLTVFTNVIFAIEIGMVLVMGKLMYDMTKSASVEAEIDDEDTNIKSIVEKNNLFKDKLAIYTIDGPFFFGAITLFEQKVNEYVHTKRRIIIVHMKHVPFIDTTALATLNSFIKSRKSEKKYVLLTGLKPAVKRYLMRDPAFSNHIQTEYVWMFETIEEAVLYATEMILPALEKKSADSKETILYDDAAQTETKPIHKIDEIAADTEKYMSAYEDVYASVDDKEK